MLLKIAPGKLYKKLEMLPVKSIKTILLRLETIKASLKPKITKVTKTTILDKPSLAPGIAIGRGILDSNMLRPKPTATNRDKNIIFFNLFIFLTF